LKWPKNAPWRTLTPNSSLASCKLVKLILKVSIPTQWNIRLPRLTQRVMMISKTLCSRKWSMSRSRSKLVTSWRASENNSVNHRLLRERSSTRTHTRLTHHLREYLKTWTSLCIQRRDTCTFSVMAAMHAQSLVSDTSAVFARTLISVRIAKRWRIILMLSWRSKEQDRLLEQFTLSMRKRNQRLRPRLLLSTHHLLFRTFLDLWVVCQVLLLVVSNLTSVQASILKNNPKLNKLMGEGQVRHQTSTTPRSLISIYQRCKLLLKRWTKVKEREVIQWRKWCKRWWVANVARQLELMETQWPIWCPRWWVANLVRKPK